MNDVPVQVNKQEKPPTSTGPAWLALAFILLVPASIPINVLLWQAVVGVR